MVVGVVSSIVGRFGHITDVSVVVRFVVSVVTYVRVVVVSVFWVARVIGVSFVAIVAVADSVVVLLNGVG